MKIKIGIKTMVVLSLLMLGLSFLSGYAAYSNRVSMSNAYRAQGILDRKILLYNQYHSLDASRNELLTPAKVYYRAMIEGHRTKRSMFVDR